MKATKKLIAAAIAVSALTFTSQVDYLPQMSIVYAEVKTYTATGTAF